MRNVSNLSLPFILVCRSAAVALLTCACTLGLQAQQSDVTSASVTPSFNLAPADLNLAGTNGVGYSSSLTPEPTETASLDFKGLPESGLQPSPRRYGRPRYNDSGHNPDGSPKYAFIAGVGGTIPVGNLHKYDTASYGFQVGAGRNFNKNFGLLLQFDYDNFGYQSSTLNNQSTIYFGATGQGLDGHSHIWSFTLDPTYSFYSRDAVGAYVVGGVGFYHKTANFTVPATGTYCDPFYGYCYQYEADETIDDYTSNAVGFNGGLGLTFKPSKFASERFYVEGRYVFVANQHKDGYDISNYQTAPLTATNFFPANSNHSTYIPIKVGIRF